jgi:hypothetical protein
MGEYRSDFRLDRRFAQVYFGTLLLTCAIPWTITIAFFLPLGGLQIVWYGLVWTADDLGLLALLSIVPCGAIWVTVGRRILRSGRSVRSAAFWTGAAMSACGTVIFTIQRGFIEGAQYSSGIGFSMGELGTLFLLPFGLFSSWLMVRRVFGGADGTSLEV